MINNFGEKDTNFRETVKNSVKQKKLGEIDKKFWEKTPTSGKLIKIPGKETKIRVNKGQMPGNTSPIPGN